MESVVFSANSIALRGRLRGALCCALLLHVLAACLLTDLPRAVVTPAAPMAIAIRLEAAQSRQDAAAVAPDAAIRPAVVQEQVVAKHAAQPSQSVPHQSKAIKHIPIKTGAQQSPFSVPVSASAPMVVAKSDLVESAVGMSAADSVAKDVPSTSKKANTSADKVGEVIITPVQYRAAHLNNPKIVMPYISRQQGESGTVRLWVKVSANGEPLAVRIEKSSGFPRLDNVAYQTVKEKWRFEPAKRGDTPMESEVAFNIPFVLHDAE